MCVQVCVDKMLLPTGDNFLYINQVRQDQTQCGDFLSSWNEVESQLILGLGRNQGWD